MGDRPRDDTREPAAEPPGERRREPGSYYYDDATGYEIYNPVIDEEEDEGKGEKAMGEDG